MRRKFKKSFSTFFVGGLSGHVTEYEPHSFFQGSSKTSYVKIPPGEWFGFAQLEDPYARLKIPGMWEMFGRDLGLTHNLINSIADKPRDPRRANSCHRR